MLRKPGRGSQGKTKHQRKISHQLIHIDWHSLSCHRFPTLSHPQTLCSQKNIQHARELEQKTANDRLWRTDDIEIRKRNCIFCGVPRFVRNKQRKLNDRTWPKQICKQIPEFFFDRFSFHIPTFSRHFCAVVTQGTGWNMENRRKVPLSLRRNLKMLARTFGSFWVITKLFFVKNFKFWKKWKNVKFSATNNRISVQLGVEIVSKVFFDWFALVFERKRKCFLRKLRTTFSRKRHF